MVDSAPFSPQIFRYGVPFANPYIGTRNPFPAEYAPAPPAKDIAFEKPVVGVSYATDWKPSHVLSWNMIVEHQIQKDILVRAGYVASKGTHLGYNADINAPTILPRRGRRRPCASPAVQGFRPHYAEHLRGQLDIQFAAIVGRETLRSRIYSRRELHLEPQS